MLVKHVVKQGLLFKNVGAMSRVAAYHGGAHHEPSTMNDLPVPQGDWHEQHARKNAKYNAFLVLGIVALAGTIGLAKSMNLIHLNFSPPKTLD